MERTANGRRVKSIVNGELSKTNADETDKWVYFDGLTGKIYNKGAIKFGDSWGWKFKGTVHEMILSRPNALSNNVQDIHYYHRNGFIPTAGSVLINDITKITKLSLKDIKIISAMTGGKSISQQMKV